MSIDAKRLHPAIPVAQPVLVATAGGQTGNPVPSAEPKGLAPGRPNLPVVGQPKRSEETVEIWVQRLTGYRLSGFERVDQQQMGQIVDIARRDPQLLGRALNCLSSDARAAQHLLLLKAADPEAYNNVAFWMDIYTSPGKAPRRDSLETMVAGIHFLGSIPGRAVDTVARVLSIIADKAPDNHWTGMQKIVGSYPQYKIEIVFIVFVGGTAEEAGTMKVFVKRFEAAAKTHPALETSAYEHNNKCEQQEGFVERMEFEEDGGNWVVHHFFEGGKTRHEKYDSQGRLFEMGLPNGVRRTRIVYSFDENGRRSLERFYVDSDFTHEIRSVYNGEGRIIQRITRYADGMEQIQKF